jgi:hypothetical protein
MKDRVKEEQQQDAFCQSLNPGNERSRIEYLFDEDNVIYKRSRARKHKLVIPRNLVNEVISMNHDPVFASHPGRKRTCEFKVLVAKYVQGH